MGKNKTTEEFIQKAKEIHGDKYDYSLVEYKANRIEVKIKCSIHGIFEQKPANHLSGNGCQKCGGNKKITTEEFIQKAKEIHGDKYDYSLVEYINTDTKVKIKCIKHDCIFEQTPYSHLNGKNGCIKCSGKVKTTDDFIKKAKEIHGDKYDYSLVEYIATESKVKIICPIHGIFEQPPHSHLSGANCLKCSIENTHINQKSTTDEFIEKAKKIHGDKYDYSLVEYITNKIKVKIRCIEHDYIFEQKSNAHLNGYGCPICGGTKKLTTEEFIEKAKETHSDKYGYSLVEYKNFDTKVKIICPIHGIFEQTPHSHLSGANCPKCTGYSVSLDDVLLKFKKNT